MLAFLWFITCLERESEKKQLAVKLSIITQSCSLSIFCNFTDEWGLALSSAVELMLVALCVYRQMDFLCSSLICEL